ncbi:hypothetical protein EVAR_94500_1 [Eumeta japonica]|uniref:Uncharacterized protein n=1 Tax=Eumeta variegata TaxID=151549 RepID=A0A4C1UW26_EUMVA|nr:hypothetical protein EVAR_94500_1 [Eumeta japonica]
MVNPLFAPQSGDSCLLRVSKLVSEVPIARQEPNSTEQKGARGRRPPRRLLGELGELGKDNSPRCRLRLIFLTVLALVPSDRLLAAGGERRIEAAWNYTVS